MFCTGEDIRERGNCVQVSFTFAPDQVDALCNVRYVKEHKDLADADKPYKVGLQILEATEETRVKLKNICTRLSMWRMRESRKGFE